MLIDLEELPKMNPLIDAAIWPLMRKGLVFDRIEILSEDRDLTLKLGQGSESYCLKIYRSSETVQAIRSELAWLRALSQETDLIVPEPADDLAGELPFTMHDPHSSKDRQCALFRWIEGSLVADLDANLAWKVGQAAACLHEHSRRWERPVGFCRKDHAAATYLDPARDECISSNELLIEQSALDVLVAALTEARSLVASSPGGFLAHGDLHKDNFLLSGDTIALLDFGECGVHHPMYDLALALYKEDNPLDTPLRSALLNGYASFAPLPDDAEISLNAMMRLRIAYMARAAVVRKSDPEGSRMRKIKALWFIEQISALS